MNSFACDNENTVAETTGGRVRGFYFHGMYHFRGIPYGKAERFHSAVEADPWSGIKNACNYGFTCPNHQPPSTGMFPLAINQPWPADEDRCLNLNVVTSSLTGQKRPVVVWLHGGAYSHGSCISNGAVAEDFLVKKAGAVFVSPNHRLNILGFCDLSEYGEEYKNSGMLGVEDIVLALKWVRNNIENFGGDPDNITLIGNSGGGEKIIALMQSPAADGMFKRALISSGVLGTMIPDNSGSVKPFLEALMRQLHLDSVKQLETVPYPELIKGMKEAKALKQEFPYSGETLRPNEFYAGDPCLIGLRECNRDIPIFITSTFGEIEGLTAPRMLSEEEALIAVRKKFKDNADAVMEEFKKTYPERKIQDLLSLDTQFRRGTIRFIREACKIGCRVVNIKLDYDFPYCEGMPAWHTSDIPFIFGTTDRNPLYQTSEAIDVIGDDIQNNVLKFVRGEHPDIPESSAGRIVTRVYDGNGIHDRADYDIALNEEIEKSDVRMYL